jgi:predicted MFS family arabinose efflux permease
MAGPVLAAAAAPPPLARHGVLTMAWSLALAAAVSLGLARFAYALLLPPMRADLGWSYATAGAMNTVNAAGYLLGALLMPVALARVDARHLVVAGGAAAAVLLAAHAAVHGDSALFALRCALGVASAVSFVGGGVLAAKLASHCEAAAVGVRAPSAGLVLGLYYGGTGLGIVLSALLLPSVISWPGAGWRAAWGVLAGLSALATLAMAWGTQGWRVQPLHAALRQSARLRPLAWGLSGYLMFGLGYIGYMTFNVSLLREQGLGQGAITVFYGLLGAGVVASSRLWASLLQRHRGGVPMMWLNGLLALATVLAVLRPGNLVLACLSGALFGSVFLSVVASTTALVRHNLPQAAWASGITAFTVVFALGQIVGPLLVGALADLLGGLSGGLLLSAGLLALGAVLASRQKAF